MVDIAQDEPLSFIAGETVIWERDFSAIYPPADGWTLKYEAVKLNKRLQFSAATSGTKYRVTITAQTTLAWSPDAGIFSWQAYVTKGSGAAEERHYLDSGNFEIVRAFSTLQSGEDSRSHVKRTLDALEAVIERRASADQQAYTIGGRSLSRIPIEQLIVFRDKYLAYYKQELAAEQINAGLKPGNRLLTRL